MCRESPPAQQLSTDCTMLCSPLSVRGSSSHHLSLSRSWETIFFFFLRSYFRSMVVHRGERGHVFLSMTKNHKCLISVTAFLIYPSHLLSLYSSLSSCLCLGSCCQHLSQKNTGRGGGMKHNEAVHFLQKSCWGVHSHIWQLYQRNGKPAEFMNRILISKCWWSSGKETSVDVMDVLTQKELKHYFTLLLFQ